MPNRPLLFFPQKAFADPLPRAGFGNEPHVPSPRRQRDRLQPYFDELERIFATRSIELRSDPTGVQPEQVLVLETIGSVQDFYNTVAKLPDLVWLGEYEIQEIEPDQDFYDPEDQAAKLEGRLYLILHNQEGLNQLRSLFEIFKSNPDHPQFRKGRRKFGHLFRQLKTIRPWNHEDRLRETGLLEDWRERAKAGQEVMRVEVELWPHRKSWHRKRAQNWIEDLIRREQGRTLAKLDAAEDYGYHGMLIELPIESVERLIEGSSIDLVKCEAVMFFRPTGQIAVPLLGEVKCSRAPEPLPPLPEGDPVAALLDGLPLTHHRCLDGRLMIDDPDQWEGEYQASDRQHGTAMASLIIHGELDSPGDPLTRKLYVRPVMKPYDSFRQREERVPDDLLTVDLIDRAVSRILDRSGSEPPAAPAVRIVNLSIGDRSRPFDRFPSPWARLLDYLSSKYNILFVVSAGNHSRSLELDIPYHDREALLSNPDRLQGEALRASLRDTRHHRLLSPAEAINVLTVGALHSDASQSPTDGIDPLNGSSLPSLYSAHGLGFNRSIKPDILFPGGRVLFREPHKGKENLQLDPRHGSRPPGQKVATPGAKAGDLSSARYLQGTSNATALVTRVACQTHEVLLTLREQGQELSPADEHLAVLIRTLLVHGASWGDRFDILRRHLGGTRAKGPAARLLGYGALDPERVLACTDQRVTILGWGMISSGRAFSYTLPLPPSLNGVTTKRRLVTTLAWFSPINFRHHQYRKACLWLAPKTPRQIESLLGLERIETDHNQARRGTVQHEVWEGARAISFSEGEILTFQVNCQAEAGGLNSLVPYGLAVTLEVAESTSLQIYDEVRAQLKIPIRPEIRF